MAAGKEAMEKVASSIFDERRESAAAGGQDFIGMFSHRGCLHVCKAVRCKQHYPSSRESNLSQWRLRYCRYLTGRIDKVHVIFLMAHMKRALTKSFLRLLHEVELARVKSA